MPVHSCEKDGKSGYQWGDQVCYTGPDAKRKAYIQGYAIQKSQERDGKSKAGERLMIDVWLARANEELEKDVLSPEFAAFADELIKVNETP